MAQSRVPRVLGLFTSPNEVSQVPSGGLLEAKNVVVRNGGLIEPRVGIQQDALLDGGGTESISVDSLTIYDEKVCCLYFSLSNNGLVSRDSIGNTTQLATFFPPDSTLLRVKYAEASQNLYYTARGGPGYVQNADSFTGKTAGLLKPPGLSAVTASSIAGLSGDPDATDNFLPVNSAVSYRVLFGYKDTNENFKLGPPSERYVVRNPANLSSALMTFSSGTVTAAVASHNLNVGDKITLVGTSGTYFTAGLTHTLTAVSTTTLTWVPTGAGTSSATGTISSGSKAAAFRCYLPSALTTDNFIRVYRTRNVTGYLSDPGDEHFLIYEAYLTSTNISDRYVDIVDTTPESALVVPLYTNPTQESILAENSAPPWCKDLTTWGSRMWYANTKQKFALSVQLLGVGSPNGFQSGDDVWLGPLKANNPTVYNTAASQSRNIALTARSIVDTINAVNFATSTQAYGYGPNVAYVEEPNGPGLIVGELNAFNGTTYEQFTWYSNRSTAWVKPPPTSASSFTVGTGNVTALGRVTAAGHGLSVNDWVVLQDDLTMTSGSLYAGVYKVSSVLSSDAFVFEYPARGASASGTNTATATFLRISEAEAFKNQSDNTELVNGLYYSKIGQPEAVPKINYLEVGSPSKQILRIVSLDSWLYVFKEDGLFVVTGSEPFSVDEVDRTCIILSPDTAVGLDASIFALTSKGVLRINASGIEKVSEPVENAISSTLSIGEEFVKRWSFGVTRPDEHSYYLFLPGTLSGLSSPGCFTCFLYNAEEDAWTNVYYQEPDTSAPVCGIITPQYATQAPSNTLFLGFEYSVYLFRERGSPSVPTSTKYADYSFATTVLSISGSTMTVGYSVGMTVGGVINTGFGEYAKITSVLGASTLEVVATNAFSTGAGTYYSPYTCSIKFVPDLGNSPDSRKHYRDGQLLFQTRGFYSGEMTFASDTDNSTTSVPVQFPDATMSIPRADNTALLPVTNRRVGVPQAHARCVYLQPGFTLTEAFGYFRLAGYSLIYTGESDRINRT